MASSDVTAVPKIRSRNEGAAVPLTDADRALLNLMQGSFPLDPTPYARVAEAAGVPEEQVLADVQRLLDDRIIRQVTPIYDTRALGYGSMLVAAKVDAENPWRAAKVINSHPGVAGKSHGGILAGQTLEARQQMPQALEAYADALRTDPLNLTAQQRYWAVRRLLEKA